jgi:hypothetical protein
LQESKDFKLALWQQFPALSIDYTGGMGPFNQEGLHRAIAAMDAGIPEVPVVMMSKANKNPRKWPGVIPDNSNVSDLGDFKKQKATQKDQILSEIQNKVYEDLNAQQLDAIYASGDITPAHKIGDRFSAGFDPNRGPGPRLEIVGMSRPETGNTAAYRVKQIWPDGRQTEVTLSDKNLAYALDRKMTGPKR